MFNNTTGTSSGTTGATSTASLTPFADSSGLLSSLLASLSNTAPAALTPRESGAINQLYNTADAGNPYAGDIGHVAKVLLGGGGPDRTGLVNDAYAAYKGALDPTVAGDYTRFSTKSPSPRRSATTCRTGLPASTPAAGAIPRGRVTRAPTCARHQRGHRPGFL